MSLSPSCDEALLALLKGPSGQTRRRHLLAERDSRAVALAPNPDHRYVVVVNAVTAEKKGIKTVRGHPYMTSALRGGGVSPKEDAVREVA